MLKIGLTGGIGCGKSTATRLFAERGINIVDADEISHQICEPSMPGYNAIVKLFSSVILDTTGRINRKKLRDLVFTSKQERTKLESALHPLIFQSIEEQAKTSTSPYCIISVPLLFETKSECRVNRVLVIDCEPIIQRGRVLDRDGITEQQLEEIRSTQLGRKERLSRADDVILNNESVIDLDKQVEKLHNFYLGLTTY